MIKPLASPQNAAQLMSFLVVALGLAVLAGWALNIPVMKSVLPGMVTMKANTALGLFLCGAVLASLSRKTISTPIRVFATLNSLVVIALATMSISEDILDINLGIDQWLFQDEVGAIDSSSPGRMSPTTAFCFVLIGISLLVASQAIPRRNRLSILSGLASVTILISGLALLGHGLNTLLGFRLWNYAGMAIHTALGFVFLAGALLMLVRSANGLHWSLDMLSSCGFAIGIISLLGVASLSYAFTTQLKLSVAWISHTQEVLKEIEEVKSGMADLEGDERGYILTGDEHLLLPREQTISEVQKDCDALHILTSDNSRQQPRIDQLRPLISQRIAWAKQTISTRKQQGYLVAQALISTHKGISLSDDINQILHTMEDEEYRLLAQRQKVSDSISTKTFLILPLGVFISLAMLALGLSFLNTGLSERKFSEEARKKSDAWFRAIFELSQFGIIMASPDAKVIMANPAAYKIFLYDDDSLVGIPVEALIAPSIRGEYLRRREEFLRNVETMKFGIEQIDAVKSDGTIFPIDLTRSIFSTPEGNYVFVMVRDITDQRQLEQQLRQSQKMEAVGQLTGGIAHDFNNLLGVILGNLDLLERLVANNEAAVKRVRTAQKAATRGADLTRSMLAFSRQQPLDPTLTRLDDSILNLIDMASRAIGPDIKITTNLDASIPPVMVDQAGLENALLNLAVNARDAMPQGGSLTISTQLIDLIDSHPLVQAEELLSGHYARVSVSDSGQGMSPETLERVFEPFFTTKPRGKGTGLGLAMVYGFVKQSAGIVKIYSELGHGTSVSLYLPIAEDAVLPVAIESRVKLTSNICGSALVVDDEVDLLEIAVVYLEEMGYRVFHATDGPSALKIIDREPAIELLVTDIIMPGGINGVELAHQIRQRIPGIKIVFSSGFPSDALAERSGMVIDGPLLYKPYHRDQFITTIHQAVSDTDVEIGGSDGAKA